MTLEAGDAARVRSASRRIGLIVGVASAIVLALGGGILITLMLVWSRDERTEHASTLGDGGTRLADGDVRLVFETERMLPIVIVLGAVGIVLLGLIAWFAARRAVAPLAAALAAQRAFVADASHELRTPLAVLDARVQVLQRRVERDEPIGPTVARLREDAKSMALVLDDMLLAAEGDAVPPTEHTDVRSAVERAVDSLAPLAAGAGVALATDAVVEAAVAMPRVSFERCIVALVDNAVQHSPRGGVVEVHVEREAQRVVVRVVDQGPGIIGVDPERVFDRFAHGPERGRRRGFGLGLALVRDVVTRYGGHVAVESTSGAGSTFRLTLPLAR